MKFISAKDNNRESYKFELIPKDGDANRGKLMSSEEIKLIFAKKGYCIYMRQHNYNYYLFIT